MLAGKSYKLHLMLLLAASNMDEDAMIRFKEIIESVVYYTVINRITTNITERTFATWCGEIREITTVENLNAFVNRSMAISHCWKTASTSLSRTRAMM